MPVYCAKDCLWDILRESLWFAVCVFITVVKSWAVFVGDRELSRWLCGYVLESHMVEEGGQALLLPKR